MAEISAMPPFVDEFLARQLATRFADFAGGEIRLRLPLRQAVVNDILAQTVVASSNGKLRHLELVFGEGNRLDVRIESSAIPLSPRLTLEFVIDRTVSLNPTPAIRLVLQRQRVTRLLAIILPFVTGLLPPEVHWANGALVVDLGMVLERNGGVALIPLLPLIQSVELESEPGLMWLNVHAHVLAPASTPVQAHDTAQP